MKIKVLMLLALMVLCVSCAQSNPAPVESTALSPGTDRIGNPIHLPGEINTIISMGPSNTEILIALGFGSHIIAADGFSMDIEGLPPDIPLFDMMAPDGEMMLNLNPDIIFITGMSRVGGEDPIKPVADAGICVIYIPASESIEGIKEDIRYIAAVMDKKPQGEVIITAMETEIEAIRAIGDIITDKKSVYFEISAAPWMYSFGTGVFLNEMIELTGAVNIFNEQESWLAAADEAIANANPDVILTSVDYLEDPIGEIKQRPGWEGLTAIQNDAVYSIDTNASNRPSHHIIKALQQMAKAIYPEYY